MLGSSCLYKNGFSVLALSAISSLASASSTMSFAYSVFAAAPASPAAVGPATAVPVTSDALLMVLAVLLAVIAIRALQSANGIQKVLSLAVLGGGLILGGVGVENTIAGIPILEIPDEGVPCDGGESSIYYPFHNGTLLLTNNCEDDLTIDSVTSDGCTPDNIVIPNAIIEAGATEAVPYCSSPEG